MVITLQKNILELRLFMKQVRVMFYYPNREQAMKIQNILETLYKGIGGEYYYGDSAWEYVKSKTTIDLKNILEEIAKENSGD